MCLPARCLWLCALVLAGLGVFAAVAQTSDHPRLMAQVASGEVIASAWSPDVRTALTGGREFLRYVGYRLNVNSVAFSHDGQSVLTGSEDGTVRLWNAGNGKNLHTLKARAR
jgi:WD40 repeat protein